MNPTRCFLFLAFIFPACSKRDLKTGSAEIEFAENAAAKSEVVKGWHGHMGSARDGRAAPSDWNRDWEAAEPNLAWKAEVGIGAAGVAIADGRAYVIGNANDQDQTICFDLKDGSKIWQTDFPCVFDKRMFDGGTATTPLLDPAGGQLFVLSHEGALRCLAMADGAERWKTHLINDLGGKLPKWGFAGAPLLVNGTLIVEPGGAGAAVVALDPATGSARWKAGDDAAAYGSPIAYPAKKGPAFASFNAHGLVGRSLADGSELFRMRWETNYDVNAATPCFFGDHFFVVSGYGKGGGLISMAGDEPQLVYETVDVMAQFQSPVRVGEQLYLVSGDNNTKARLSCLNFKDGTLRWAEPLGGNRGSLIAAGEHLIVTTERGEAILFSADAERFSELGRFQASGGRVWAQPALADGRLVVRNNAGRVTCWDLR